MNLESGSIIILKGNQYIIRGPLGRGAVSDVYLAALGASEVVIKVLGDDRISDSNKIEAMKHEAEVLDILNSAEMPDWKAYQTPIERLEKIQATVAERSIIALLDYGHLEDHRPILIQEKAPEAVRRFPVEGPADERRVMELAVKLANALVLVHRCHLALKDFDPRGLKLDRVRRDPQQGSLKIIDWNITGTDDDQRLDLLYFGGHLFYLLLGRHVPFGSAGESGEIRTPVNPGLGIATWTRLTEGTRRILERLLHFQPDQRYSSARSLYEDLVWWHETLCAAETQNAVELLRARVAQAGRRADRRLAVADLAGRLNLDHSDSFFAGVRDAAYKALEENELALLDAGLRQWNLGNYRSAVGEFEQLSRDPMLNPELRRKAYLYYLQASIGQSLQDTTARGGTS